MDPRVANGWEAVPYIYGGERAGTAWILGAEIHFELHRPRSIHRHAAREFLRPLLAREGFLTTRVSHGDAPSGRFVRKLGFEFTWSDETYDYFMLTDLPFGKEN